MKTKLLAIPLFFLITCIIYAQNIEDFNEILTNQEAPGRLQLVDNFLYVLEDEGTNLTRFDLDQFPITSEIIYTLPTSSDPDVDNVLNDFLVIGNTLYLTSEEFNESLDMGLGSTIFSLDLTDNTATTTEIVNTGSGGFISSFEVVGDNVYYTQDNNTDDSYFLYRKSTTNLSATSTTLASTNGDEINDIATDGTLIYLANRDTGEIHYYNITESATTLSTLNFSESFGFVNNLAIQNNRIYITSGNKVISGQLSTTETIEVFTNLENTFYEDTNSGSTFFTNFDGITVDEDGKGYASISNEGIIGDSFFFSLNECTGTSSSFEEIITSLESPDVIEQLNNNELIISNNSGISSYNLTTELSTVIYTKSNNEFITDITVDGEDLFFASIFGTEDAEGDFIFDTSEIVHINLTNNFDDLIYFSSDEFIFGLQKNGNDLYFYHEPSDFDNTEISSIDQIDLNDNSFVELNVDYNFFLESAFLLNDTLYLAENSNLYTAPLSDLTDLTLLSDTTNFIGDLSIEDGFIYYAQSNSIKRVPLNFTDFNGESEFIAFNATYVDEEDDGSIFCSSIDSFTIIDDTIYATFEFNDLVVSIPNETVTLSNSLTESSPLNLPFVSVEGNNLSIHNVTKTSIIDVYDLSGKKLISSPQNKIDVSGLSTGIYIVNINSTTQLKFIKK